MLRLTPIDGELWLTKTLASGGVVGAFWSETALSAPAEERSGAVSGWAWFGLLGNGAGSGGKLGAGGAENDGGGGMSWVGTCSLVGMASMSLTASGVDKLA